LLNRWIFLCFYHFLKWQSKEKNIF
jgi:hypothetical protein